MLPAQHQLFLYYSCDGNTDRMLQVTIRLFMYCSWLTLSYFFFLFYPLPPFSFLALLNYFIRVQDLDKSGIPDKPLLPAQHLVIKLQNKGNEKHISQHLFPSSLRINQYSS